MVSLVLTLFKFSIMTKILPGKPCHLKKLVLKGLMLGKLFLWKKCMQEIPG